MAMEGPTPVSALIHAATMVTAGVYLLIRTSPLIEYSSIVLLLCLWIGSITTLFSSLIGLFQQDIKKVIAYSTMSQLGMMFIAVGLSSYNLALFHLINHAFYKGLLFLGAGAVIHAVADNQDFRKYGSLKSFLPLTYSVMLIASLSLVAFPFMTGFYSKDFILESSYGQFYFSGIVVYFIASIGAIFTTLYSVKVLYLTFLTNPNGPLINYKIAREGNVFINLPLIILAVFSIFFGYITKDMFIGLGSGLFIDNSIYVHTLHEIMLNTEFAVPIIFKILPLIFTLLFSFLALILSEFIPKLLIYFKFSRFGYNIFGFFNQRFLIELFYNKYVTNLILDLGGQTTKIIDEGSVELLGPYGLEKGLINLSNSIANLSTGNITTYALYILVGFIIYILTPYLYIIDNSLLLLLLLGLFYIKKKYYFSKLDKKDNFVLYNMQNNILDIFKRIKEKIFNKENIITVITYSVIIYIIRFCLIYFGIDIRLSYFLILLSKFSRDVVGEIVNYFFNYNNIKLPIGGDIDNSYTNKIIQKDNKKLSNINTMCSDGSEPDVDMTDAPPIDSDSGNRSGSATPTLSRETTPTPASVAAAISARAALDSTVPIPPNNPNFNSNSSENSSSNAPPISMPIADAAQRIGAIRSLPIDFRIRNPYFSDNPAPGTLTPEAEDIFYNENEKKEHLVNMQKLRKQMYDVSPIA
jgi:Proton-conducting membrane transporter/NADH dehydrogenase subunit 5 C-terminus